jgi:hypothetical protein
MTWKYPSEPRFVQAWTTELLAEDHNKPIAGNTPFRHSSALSCSRRQVFSALGLQPTEPFDAAATHVTTLGTLIHEHLQDAIGRRYPGARFEVVSTVGQTSGSADAVIELPDRRVLWELKTVGAFAFDRAIGLNRKGYRRVPPKGPRPSAICQAAINAIGHDCNEVVVAYLAMEAVSKQLAEKVGLSQLDRIMAEWVVPPDVWRPMATAELDRLDKLAAAVERREVPEGDAYDEERDEWVPISPLQDRRHWSCDYCPYTSACIAHESGVEVI